VVGEIITKLLRVLPLYKLLTFFKDKIRLGTANRNIRISPLAAKAFSSILLLYLG
jgi:hypothetical protein